MSEDTFFSPFSLLGVLEGTSLTIASSGHKFVLSLSESVDNICSKFQKLLPNEKKKSFLLLTLS